MKTEISKVEGVIIYRDNLFFVKRGDESIELHPESVYGVEIGSLVKYETIIIQNKKYAKIIS